MSVRVRVFVCVFITVQPRVVRCTILRRPRQHSISNVVIACFSLHFSLFETLTKDHITLEDYEIHDGMGLELYYQ